MPIERPSRNTCLVIGLVVLAAVLLLLPDLLFLDSWTPFVQAVAFRPVLTALALATAVTLIALRRPATTWAGLVLLVVCVVSAVMVLPRTFSIPLDDGDTRLRTLTVNVSGNHDTVGDVAKIIRRHDAEVVALPEADESYRVALETALAGDYRGVSAQTGATAVSAVSALYHRSLGEVNAEVQVLGSFPAWVLSGDGLGDVRFVAVHAYPPLPLATDRWSGDLAEIAHLCAKTGPVIIAGDFNATLDHGALRRGMAGCEDTAAQLGAGLHGTWPSSVPSWLGAQIDHVLYRDLRPHAVDFAELPGTDHRAVASEFTAGS